jgi:EAL domain-containing protein (putative c-di-GMP-specific phosphodiesterase class I)
VPLGRWALGEATRQLAQWSRALGDGRALTMTINVSARQIRDPRLTEDVRDAIAAAGIAPERVVLEVTETMLVHDPAEVADVLRALKALGFVSPSTTSAPATPRCPTCRTSRSTSSKSTRRSSPR